MRVAEEATSDPTDEQGQDELVALRWLDRQIQQCDLTGRTCFRISRRVASSVLQAALAQKAPELKKRKPTYVRAGVAA
jgi:hypothetical protein